MLFSMTTILQKSDQLKVPQKARVVYNEDPEGGLKGRIKVTIPTVFELTPEQEAAQDYSSLPWVYRQRESFLGGAQNTSSNAVPNVGTDIVVVFPFGIYHPLYVGVWDTDLTISPLFFEDYPNTYGFVDDQGDYFRVNKVAGYTEYVHNSGSYFLMDRAGNMTCLTMGDWDEEVRGNRHVRVKGNEHIVVEGSRFLDVTGNQTIHVDGSEYTSIEGARTTLIGSNDGLEVTGNQSLKVTGNKNTLVSGTEDHKVTGKWNMAGTSNIELHSDADLLLQGNNLRATATTDMNLNSQGTGTVYAATTLNLYGTTNTLLATGVPSVVTPTTTTDPTAIIIPDSPDDMKSITQLVALEGQQAPKDAEFHPTFGNPGFEQPVTVKEMTDAGDPPPSVTDTKPPTKPTPPAVDAGQVQTGGSVNYELQLSPRFKLKNLTNNCVFNHSIPDSGWAGFTADQLCTNLKHLCVNVLEPIVDRWPGMRINCAFRKQTGRSQHPRGMAADLQWPGHNVKQMFEIAQWIKDNINFDQLLFEHGNSAWIHVSYNKDGNRTNNTHVMSYKPGGWANGRQYTEGLICAYPNPASIVVGSGGGAPVFT